MAFDLNKAKSWFQVGFKYIGYVGSMIAAAEDLASAKTGEDKKKSVETAIELVINATEFATHKEILNDPIVKEAVSAYIDAYVAVQNAIALTLRAQAGSVGGASQGQPVKIKKAK